MKNRLFILFALFFALFTSLKLLSQDGQLDPDFIHGTQYLPAPGVEHYAMDAIQQKDGKILVCGYLESCGTRELLLLRFNEDGTLDEGFKAKDYLKAQKPKKGGASFLKIKIHDDKILLCGYSQQQGLLLRLNTDGTPDLGFGNKGFLSSQKLAQINDFAVFESEEDQQIIAIGHIGRIKQKAAIEKFTSLGKVDFTFADNGLLQLPSSSKSSTFSVIGKTSKGHLLACANIKSQKDKQEDVHIIKFDRDGRILKGFGCGKGIVVVDAPIPGKQNRVSAIQIKSNGKILISGDYCSDTNLNAYICCLNYNGFPDKNFGKKRNGYYSSAYQDENDQISSFIVQNNGRIIVGGRSDFNGHFDFSLNRLHSNGLPDRNFGNNSWLLQDFCSGDDNIVSLLIDKKGYLLTVGNCQTKTGNHIVLAKFILSERRLHPYFAVNSKKHKAHF